MVVNLNDHVGALLERLGEFGFGLRRSGSGSPTANQPGRGNAGPAETWVGPVRAGHGHLPSFSGGIQKYESMVDYAAIAGTEFGAADVDVVIETGGNHEAPKLIRPIRGQLVLDGRGQDQVR